MLCLQIVWAWSPSATSELHRGLTAELARRLCGGNAEPPAVGALALPTGLTAESAEDAEEAEAKARGTAADSGGLATAHGANR